MVASREIYWANLGAPAGRRPVCILTRDPAAGYLGRIVAAQVTRTIRGTRSEVVVGAVEGLPAASVVNCDNIVTVANHQLDPNPIGRLGADKQRELNNALRYALAIKR